MRKEAFIHLTNRRLIVIPANVTFQGYSLTGMLSAKIATTLHNKMVSGQPRIISIPFEYIKNIKDDKFGLLVKALIVETIDDEMLKITVSKRDEWKETIINAANLR